MFGYRKNFLFALSILIGTIIGAGIFGIPYVISKSGIIPGFFYFLLLGGIVLLVHLFFGEIVLRTEGDHRLVGLGEKYLGKWANKTLAVSVVLGVIGSLLAYLIIGGEFLSILVSGYSSISPFQATLILWLASLFFICRGLKFIAPATGWTNILFFLTIGTVICFCLPKFNPSNFSLFNPKDIFLPYGVILYSFVGWSAIPEITEFLKTKEERKNVKKIIILGLLISAILYFVFTLAIVGITGNLTSSDAFSGLIPFLGKNIVFLGALAGLLTVADSFLVIALYLLNTFVRDLRISRVPAIFICCGVPLALFLLGFRSFIETIGFVGTLLGVIEVVLIILIFKKAKISGDREPEYSLKVPSAILYILMAIFILGAIIQILTI
jgi:tyrosine-specific transport protein